MTYHRRTRHHVHHAPDDGLDHVFLPSYMDIMKVVRKQFGFSFENSSKFGMISERDRVLALVDLPMDCSECSQL